MKKMIVLLSFLALLITAACGNSTSDITASPSPVEESPLEKVTLLLAAGGNAMYYAYVAKEKEYFKEEGLDVDLVAGIGGGNLIQQLIDETAHIGIIGVAMLLPFWDQGADIQAVYQINATNLFDLIVPKYSNITDVTQLKGKVIGVTEFGSAETPMVRSILASANFKADEDVMIREMGKDPTTILKAFDNGEIAAFSGGAHDLVSLYATGFKSTSLVPKEYKSLPSTAIIANGEFIRERPDVVEKILRAIARATEFSIKDRNSTLAIMKEAVPNQYKDEVAGQLFLNTFIDLATPIDTAKGYGFINHELWEKLIELYSTGDTPVVTKDLDLDKFLNTSFLENANMLKE